MPGLRLTILGLLLLAVLTACGGNETQTAPPDRLGWWRDARFGLFVHWGLYAVPAGRWGDETEHAEWIRHSAKIPRADYAKLVDRFDPQAFDADAWCRMAKDAGMRYVVLTSKHHDGFCLWDSAETAFDVASTPYGKDILTQLESACRKHGLRFGLYHSIMDWDHADYLPRRPWERATRPADDAEFERYVGYLRRQVTELLTNHEDLALLWFDGQWEHTWNHEYGQALYDLCLSYQPSIVVNDRVDTGRLGHSGRVAEGYAGDYGTPEQTVPTEGLADLDWETCMTMNQHWGWNEADEEWKSSEVLIRMLVDIVSRNGNFLLNVGPRADGTFPPEAVSRLAAIGTWMRANGDAIYGTGAAPFTPPAWGRLTMRRDGDDTLLYLHVFDRPADGRLVLSGVGNEVTRAWMPSDAKAGVAVRREELDLVITLPAAAETVAVSVVGLRLEGAPIAYRVPEIVAASDVLVGRLLVRLEAPAPLDVRYTLDGTDPTIDCERYGEPIVLDATTVVKARAFHGERAVSVVRARQFVRVEPWPAVEAVDAVPGLRREVYAGRFEALPDFETLTPESSRTVFAIDLEPTKAREDTARRFRGLLEVPEDDVYVFRLASDDGSRLTIDDRVVVDNDGLHGVRVMEGVAPLAAGRHALLVEWFNRSGGAVLRLTLGPAGAGQGALPKDRLFHD